MGSSRCTAFLLRTVLFGPTVCHGRVCALIGEQKCLCCLMQATSFRKSLFCRYSVSAAVSLYFCRGALVVLCAGHSLQGAPGDRPGCPWSRHSASSSGPLPSLSVAPIPAAELPESRTRTPRAYPDHTDEEVRGLCRGWDLNLFLRWSLCVTGSSLVARPVASPPGHSVLPTDHKSQG